ncbi:MAG TPA: hypothetical protein VF608_02925, partial [Thermoanaerobaculia bacterium]
MAEPIGNNTAVLAKQARAVAGVELRVETFRECSLDCSAFGCVSSSRDETVAFLDKTSRNRTRE